MGEEDEKVVITSEDVEVVDPASLEGPDLQAAWEGQIDDEALKQAESELLLPVGWFTTVPGSFKGRLEKREDDPDRPVASFFGRIIKYDDTTKTHAVDPASGKEISGAQGYRISPMRRNKITEKDGVKVDTGKPDFKHNLFIQAAHAYAKAYDGTRATKPAQVLEYLNNFPHQIRVTKTQDNRNLVVAIRAVPTEE